MFFGHPWLVVESLGLLCNHHTFSLFLQCHSQCPDWQPLPAIHTVPVWPVVALLSVLLLEPPMAAATTQLQHPLHEHSHLQKHQRWSNDPALKACEACWNWCTSRQIYGDNGTVCMKTVSIYVISCKDGIRWNNFQSQNPKTSSKVWKPLVTSNCIIVMISPQQHFSVMLHFWNNGNLYQGT